MIKDFLPQPDLLLRGRRSFGFMVGILYGTRMPVTATLLACENVQWQKAITVSFYKDLKIAMWTWIF